MTLRRSSGNVRRKGARYSFFSALKVSAVPGGLLALMYLGVMGGVPYMDFDSRMEEWLTRAENLALIRRQIKYILFPADPFLIAFLLFAAAGLSVLAGILVFRFCADKRTVNVYYSLGITRSSLFCSRYFAGLCCFALAFVPAVTACFFVNVAYAGLSWQLSLLLFYFYCGLTLFCQLCYTVTAAVFASVGTVYEGVIFSFGVLGAPTVFELAADGVRQCFLTHISRADSVMTFTGRYVSGDAFDSLTSLSAYNPLLFFLRPLQAYAVGPMDGDGHVLLADETRWVFPDVGKPLIWLLVCAAVAALGGLLFRRRKAETCGFLNTNKVLSNLVLFELIAGVGGMLLSERGYIDVEVIELVPTFLITALFLYLVYEVLLKRTVRGVVTALYKFPIHVGVFALICAFVAFDFAGVDTYVPAPESVQAAAVTAPVDQSWIRGALQEDAGYVGSFMDPGYLIYTQYELPEFTSAQDIAAVTALHADALAAEKDAPDMEEVTVTLRYVLKDGRETMRAVTVGSRALFGRLLDLFDSGAVKQARTAILTSATPLEAGVGTGSYPQFDYDQAEVSAVAPTFAERTVLHLTKDQFTALKTAVANDLNRISAADWFAGTEEQLGVLRFAQAGTPFYGDEDMTPGMADETPADETPAEETPAEDTPAEEEAAPSDGTDGPAEEETPAPDGTDAPAHKETGCYLGYGRLSYIAYNENTYDVLITPGMTETLALLQTLGCGDCFAQEMTVKRVSFVKLGLEDEIPYRISRSDRLYEAFGGSVDPEEYVTDPSRFAADYTENPITDAAKIAELLPLTRIHAYTYNTGYACLLDHGDGIYSVRYLPEDKAPDYVTNYDYVIGTESFEY